MMKNIAIEKRHSIYGGRAISGQQFGQIVSEYFKRENENCSLYVLAHGIHHALPFEIPIHVVNDVMKDIIEQYPRQSGNFHLAAS